MAHYFIQKTWNKHCPTIIGKPSKDKCGITLAARGGCCVHCGTNCWQSPLYVLQFLQILFEVNCWFALCKKFSACRPTGVHTTQSPSFLLSSLLHNHLCHNIAILTVTMMLKKWNTDIVLFFHMWMLFELFSENVQPGASCVFEFIWLPFHL